jgi:hypothetical protein
MLPTKKASIHNTIKAIGLSITTKMTDEEERATGVRLEPAAARAPPHPVHRFVRRNHRELRAFTSGTAHITRRLPNAIKTPAMRQSTLPEESG